MKEELKNALLGPLNKNNPVAIQVLGICSALAVTVQLKPAIVIGISVTIIVAIVDHCGVSSFFPRRQRTSRH